MGFLWGFPANELAVLSLYTDQSKTNHRFREKLGLGNYVYVYVVVLPYWLASRMIEIKSNHYD